MQVLLGLEPRDEDVAITLVHDLDVDESLPRHDCLHEAEVEAPDHDDSEDDAQRCHDDPVLDVVDVEDLVARGRRSLATSRLLQAVFAILLQE